jgi:tetratricopeptide (TPR) repeat protein
LLRRSATHAFDAGRLQLDLGWAYEAGGRGPEAREAFASAVAMWREQKAPGSLLAVALSRQGHFLLTQKDANGAKAAFEEALRISAEHFSESAISGEAGLAAVAVLQGDTSAALEASARSMEHLNRIEGDYDIRVQPLVWEIRVRALRLAGNDDAAHTLAARAHDAAILYYAPDSPRIAAANSLLRNDPVRASIR